MSKRPDQHPNALDFEVNDDNVNWAVFEPNSGKEIHVGCGLNRDHATRAAVEYIAERRPGLYIIKNITGYTGWHKGFRMWAPMPYGPTADIEAVRIHAATLPIAEGGPVHIITC